MSGFFNPFGTESQCAGALEKTRWPDGFRRPGRGAAAHCVVRGARRKMFQCNACRQQTSRMAGTVLQGTQLRLTVGFLAISLISPAKTGRSALALKRHLGVSDPTAWLIHHQLIKRWPSARRALSSRARFRSTMPSRGRTQWRQGRSRL